jgi:hypothetical protein
MCAVKFTDKHFTVEVRIAKIYVVEIQHAKTHARSDILSSSILKIVGNKTCSMVHRKVANSNCIMDLAELKYDDMATNTRTHLFVHFNSTFCIRLNYNSLLIFM